MRLPSELVLVCDARLVETDLRVLDSVLQFHPGGMGLEIGSVLECVALELISTLPACPDRHRCVLLNLSRDAE